MSGCSDSRIVAEGDTVIVHYTGTLDDGTEFDSSRDRDPLEFTLGAGQMIPGFENAVYGMKKGQTKTVTIPPEEAYGPRDETLIMEVNRDLLPEELNLSIGSEVTITLANGNQTTAVVTEITETTVTLDMNFFLAGEALTFEITLVDIK
jgi:peptidylprolyl isomerase